jgi:TrmH family RNA methyltransferase
MLDLKELPQIGATHAALKDYLAYRDNLHGNPERLLPIEGLWAHEVAIKQHVEIRTAFICLELLKSLEYESMAQAVAQKAGRTFIVSEKVFEKISEREGPSGVASIVKPVNFFENDFGPLSKVKRIVIMDAVEIPGNVGTILRALDGLGESALVLTNRRVRLTHPKVVKGSLGAVFTVPLITAGVPEVLAYLAQNKILLFAADSSNKAKVVDFSAASIPEKFALVLGSEKYGIPQEIYDAKPTGIRIPMSGVCDSLNVSIAGAILLYGLVMRGETNCS